MIRRIRSIWFHITRRSRWLRWLIYGPKYLGYPCQLCGHPYETATLNVGMTDEITYKSWRCQHCKTRNRITMPQYHRYRNAQESQMRFALWHARWSHTWGKGY